jgi:hypothetical protein
MGASVSWLTTLSICDAAIRIGQAEPPQMQSECGLHRSIHVASHQTGTATAALFFGMQDMRYSTQDTDMTTLTAA